MLAGMIYTHQDQPRIVRRVVAPPTGHYSSGAMSFVELADPVTMATIEYRHDPEAPLVILPECTACGAPKGFPCRAGTACNPSLAMAWNPDLVAATYRRAGHPAEWAALQGAESANPTNPF